MLLHRKNMSLVLTIPFSGFSLVLPSLLYSLNTDRNEWVTVLRQPLHHHHCIFYIEISCPGKPRDNARNNRSLKLWIRKRSLLNAAPPSLPSLLLHAERWNVDNPEQLACNKMMVVGEQYVPVFFSARAKVLTEPFIKNVRIQASTVKQASPCLFWRCANVPF